MDQQKILNTCGLFDGVDIAQIKSLLAQLRTVTFADQEDLCRFGQAGDRLWIILDGDVVVRMPSGVKEQNITKRSVGEIIGEQGLVDRAMRTATLSALGPVKALALDRASLDAIKDDALKMLLWRNLAVILSRKLAQASDRRAHLIAEDANVKAMLKAFVNEHGLSWAGDKVRDDLKKEHVVVWFSDVAGFGALVEELQAEETAKLVRTCMEAQADAIESRGGYVDKYMGDGLMAYWVFADSEADKARACKAAVEAAEVAVQAVQGYRTPLPNHSLGLRVGLHVGAALSGNFGTKTRYGFTLIGRDVNLAARLEQAKKGEGDQPLGSIRVSEALRAALPSDLQATFATPARIKVKEADCTIFTNGAEVAKGEAA